MRRALAAAVVAVLLLACGCSARQPASRVTLTATPQRALFDTPVTIRVSGLPAGRHVVIRATAADEHGVMWSASVVVFGGSEGGLAVRIEAQLLAAHGYPALALAYFHEPGLPANLERIPLEYFARAVRLLDRQPGVDRTRVAVWGISRGSEAALLTGAHFPSLVHAVVAAVPSSVVNPGLPGPNQPAWTFDGRPVPTVPPGDLGDPEARALPAAMIPVEKIAGPIFLVCGGLDEIWPSCGYSDAIVMRLAAHHARYRPVELRYPQAGHFVGSLIPDWPDTETSGQTASGMRLASGGTPAANAAAATDAWAKLLTFLAAIPT